MADWTDIPDENLLPGRPARSVDAIALRDNVTAQAEGATGAPKSQTDSYGDNTITVPKLKSSTGTPSVVVSGRGGFTLSQGAAAKYDAPFVILTDGDYQVQAVTTGNGSRDVLVRLNGSVVFSSSESSSSGTKNYIAEFSSGDVVEVGMVVTGSGATATIHSIRLYAPELVIVN